MTRVICEIFLQVGEKVYKLWYFPFPTAVVYSLICGVKYVVCFVGPHIEKLPVNKIIICLLEGSVLVKNHVCSLLNISGNVK